MTAMITARAVTKSFPLTQATHSQPATTIEVLHGVDLSINRGEFVAVMGASGSGKSTLLYALSGIDLPTSGTVELAGTDLAALSPSELEAFRLATIGFVFQQPQLLEGCSLRENALLPAGWLKGRDRQAAAAETAERLDELGIAHVADEDAATVSGGERQRAGIARALVNQPQVLFADEPTGALDSQSAAAVMDIFEELHAAGQTIVMVTHDPQVAARAERIIRVVDGLVA